jgi:hypothetical protein
VRPVIKLGPSFPVDGRLHHETHSWLKSLGAVQKNLLATVKGMNVWKCGDPKVHRNRMKFGLVKIHGCFIRSRKKAATASTGGKY